MLDRLAEAQVALEIQPPALLIVGETTRYAERYSWFAPSKIERFGDGLVEVVDRGLVGANRLPECRLELLTTSERVRLVVHDDGRGRGGAAEGSGIRGMRERAVLIGATLRLGASPLGGARVTLELPPT